MEKSKQDIKKILEKNPVDTTLFDQSIKRLLQSPPIKQSEIKGKKKDKSPKK